MEAYRACPHSALGATLTPAECDPPSNKLTERLEQALDDRYEKTGGCERAGAEYFPVASKLRSAPRTGLCEMSV